MRSWVPYGVNLARRPRLVCIENKNGKCYQDRYMLIVLGTESSSQMFGPFLLLPYRSTVEADVQWLE